MECFMKNFKYHYWILHKKLVCDEIFRISQKSTHISYIGLRIFKSHIPEHPFSLAGHKWFKCVAESSFRCIDGTIGIAIRSFDSEDDLFIFAHLGNRPKHLTFLRFWGIAS